MADASQPSTKPTALAFALGAMDASLRANSEEVSRHREAIEQLPDKLAIHFAPRFEALENRSKDHDGRILVLEGDKRFVKGAFWVVATAIVILGGKAFIFR